MLKKGDIIEIKAGKLVYQGVCLSELDGKKVFLEKAIPGDYVSARLKKIKKDYLEAVTERVLISSESRISPKCRHFGICGGCKIQDMEYSAQSTAKEEIVKDIYNRIAKLKEIEIKPILSADNTFFYRNKMEYSFSDKRWLLNDINYSEEEKNFALGLHIPERYDKVLHLEDCFLQSDYSNRIRNYFSDFMTKRKVSVFSLQNREGLLKSLIIRESANTRDKMINLITTYFDESLINELSAEIKSRFPETTTFVNNLSDKNISSTIGFDTKIIFGTGYIYEKLLGYQFEIGSNSFFQTNTFQAEKMFSFVNDNLKPDKNGVLLDLFCGAGAIGILLANKFNRVIGIEQSAEAVESAKRNAVLNNIDNISFLAGDLNKGFDKSILGNFENLTVIIDPPRAGIHEKTIRQILELKPNQIIYISCNPATQARDILSFIPQYSIEFLQPADLFPHTYHIENIAVIKIL